VRAEETEANGAPFETELVPGSPGTRAVTAVDAKPDGRHWSKPTRSLASRLPDSRELARQPARLLGSRRSSYPSAYGGFSLRSCNTLGCDSVAV